MKNFIIETERLGLRKWLEKDIPTFIEMNNDKEVMKYFPNVLTENETIEMVERIKTHFEKNNFGLYAVELKPSKEFIGFTGFAKPTFESFFTPCIEIGWRLRKNKWGFGYATEAANACLKYGFDELEFNEIYSFTSTLNLSSEKVMQRIGMKKIGPFEHPKIEENHILKKHLLYKIENENSINT